MQNKRYKLKYNIFILLIIMLRLNMISAKQNSSPLNYYIHHTNPRPTDSDSAFVLCERPTQPNSMTQTKNIKAVEIDNWLTNCQVPETPYSEILSELNINISSIEELTLAFGSQSNNISLSTYHFQGFQALKTLKVQYMSYDRRTNSKDSVKISDFFEPLKQLAELYLAGSNNIILRGLVIPKSSELINITLVNGISEKDFGGCQRLERLELEKWDLNDTRGRFLAHCPVLKYLRVHEMSSMSVEVLGRVLSGLKELRELIITKCYFQYLPLEEGILTESLLLERIDFSNNGIITVSMPHLPRVTYLNLEFNDVLNGEIIVNVLKQLKILKYLDLSSNYNLNMCEQRHMRKVTDVKHEHLQLLVLSFTKTNELCFENFTALSKLNLVGNSMTVVDFKRFPKSQAQELLIQLPFNEITKIIFEKEDYFHLKQKNHGLVKLVSWFSLELSCDCEDTWLIKAFRDSDSLILISPRNESATITCNKENIINIPLNQVECSKFNCAENCTCRSDWQTYAVTAECVDSNITYISNIDNLTTLYASTNDIEYISDSMFKNLTYLDVYNNKIKRIKPDILKVFFKSNKGRLKLANNPIICDCENKEFVKLLQKFKGQVEDYKLIACGVDNKLISKIDPEELCEPLVPPSVIAVLAGVLAVMAVTVAAYIKYQREFKVFLYSNGCMFLVRVEELDAGLTYDAFISYSHEDELFVMDTLVTGLESEPHIFKLCLHDRDWIPGEFIPAQITASVENSRRTIIVMTKQYLTSPWCLLEFRTAHEETLKIGRPRIIVVLLEDITDLEALDPELRSYLANYTYLKYSDSRFWQKLRYAMPHIIRHNE